MDKKLIQLVRDTGLSVSWCKKVLACHRGDYKQAREYLKGEGNINFIS
jgi:translation elongation factor EF-Ts